MTIGLFIALMLEAGVEYLHHREIVRASRENIRHELEANHHNAQEDIKSLGRSGDKIKAGLATLRYVQAHRNAKGQSISFSVEFSDLSEAAWRTARDTGALGYMPLEEVQQYASLYGMQDTITQQVVPLLTRQAESLAPILANNEDFQSMSDQDFATMRQAGARNYEDVTILQQLLRNLDQEYVAALQGK